MRTDRGGDVTYHGPGQLVAYPVLSVPMGSRAIPCYVHKVEQVVIDALSDLGLDARRLGRLDAFPGVWVDPEGPSPRKICAVGIRVSRGRSMHGLALNVNPDMAWFSRIVPCGIARYGGDLASGRGSRLLDERRGGCRHRAGGRCMGAGWRVRPSGHRRTQGAPGSTSRCAEVSGFSERGSDCVRPG